VRSDPQPDVDNATVGSSMRAMHCILCELWGNIRFEDVLPFVFTFVFLVKKGWMHRTKHAPRREGAALRGSALSAENRLRWEAVFRRERRPISLDRWFDPWGQCALLRGAKRSLWALCQNEAALCA
jgi:hypothetical protein